MRIVHRAREAVDVLACRGVLAGPAAAEQLRDAIDRLIRLGEPIVILDLTGLERLEPEFVDEIGRCRTRIRAAGGVVKVAATGEPREALRTAGLTRSIETFDGGDQAIESFYARTATVGIP